MEIEEGLDLFQALIGMEAVEGVSNLYGEGKKGLLNFFFFICPARKRRILRKNRNETGFFPDYKYEEVLTQATMERIEVVNQFLREFSSEIEIEYQCLCVFSSADALTLFPIPAEPPVPPREIGEIPVLSNYEIVLENLTRFGRIFQERPWEGVPLKWRELEYNRLAELLPREAPERLIRDFVERVWAGFALDGVLAREGVFGPNPVLLGVESRGVVVLQNAALPRQLWLPNIQLI